MKNFDIEPPRRKNRRATCRARNYTVATTISISNILKNDRYKIGVRRDRGKKKGCLKYIFTCFPVIKKMKQKNQKDPIFSSAFRVFFVFTNYVHDLESLWLDFLKILPRFDISNKNTT